MLHQDRSLFYKLSQSLCTASVTIAAILSTSCLLLLRNPGSNFHCVFNVALTVMFYDPMITQQEFLIL